MHLDYRMYMPNLRQPNCINNIRDPTSAWWSSAGTTQPSTLWRLVFTTPEPPSSTMSEFTYTPRHREPWAWDSWRLRKLMHRGWERLQWKNPPTWLRAGRFIPIRQHATPIGISHSISGVKSPKSTCLHVILQFLCVFPLCNGWGVYGG